MIRTDKVAVLLPVYKCDNPSYLRLAIESLLNQTFPNIYIFIGVDGSIGSQLDMCLNQFFPNEKIQIIHFDENRGLAAVLNDLLHECFLKDFEFIARMDADDISLKYRIELQLDFLKKHSEIDVIGGGIEEIDEKSQRTGKKISYPLTHKQCYDFFRYRDPLAHPAVMFRRSFFYKVRGYRNEYRKNQDTMLWFDGFMNGCLFSNLNDTILLFRVTDDFYKNRRNGYKRAKKMLKDRFMMNKTLHYDFSSYLFSLIMFVMTLTPFFIKRWLYRIR